MIGLLVAGGRARRGRPPRGAPVPPAGAAADGRRAADLAAAAAGLGPGAARRSSAIAIVDQLARAARPAARRRADAHRRGRARRRSSAARWRRSSRRHPPRDRLPRDRRRRARAARLRRARSGGVGPDPGVAGGARGVEDGGRRLVGGDGGPVRDARDPGPPGLDPPLADPRRGADGRGGRDLRAARAGWRSRRGPTWPSCRGSGIAWLIALAGVATLPTYVRLLAIGTGPATSRVRRRGARAVVRIPRRRRRCRWRSRGRRRDGGRDQRRRHGGRRAAERRHGRTPSPRRRPARATVPAGTRRPPLRAPGWRGREPRRARSRPPWGGARRRPCGATGRAAWPRRARARGARGPHVVGRAGHRRRRERGRADRDGAATD